MSRCSPRCLLQDHRCSERLRGALIGKAHTSPSINPTFVRRRKAPSFAVANDPERTPLQVEAIGAFELGT